MAIPDPALQLDIANDALVGIGEKVLTSLPLPDGSQFTAQGALILQRYERAANWCLSRHKWEFAKVQAQLAQSTTKPVFDWAFAYPLPTDPLYLRLVRMGFNIDSLGPVTDTPATEVTFPRQDPRVRFAMGVLCIGGTDRKVLLTDFDEVFIEYIGRVSETVWPPYFAEIVVQKLKIELTLALTDKESRAARYRDEFEGFQGRPGMLTRAIMIDSANAPNQGVVDDAGFISGR